MAVHIRRGDYVNNSRTSKFHGNLDLKYYNKSIKFLKINLKILNFFFSDDINWVKKKFNNKKYHFIENDKKKLKCLLVI